MRLLLLAAFFAAHPAHAQDAAEPMPANPFAGFDSYRLPNGMRVWYGHLPASSLTSMAVIVPYGRDQDEHGREQTAHLLEHVLLSDRHGRSEAELVRELTARGGSHNGVTGAGSTYYPLSIGTEQAAFGVRWLYDVVAPRVLSDHLVARNRDPVAIELSARRVGAMARPLRSWLTHPRLLPQPFWKREFGIDAQEERGADQHASLGAITATDVQRFFDTYYTPTEMTLVIVTGASWQQLAPEVENTFGALPWRVPPAVAAVATPRQSESRLFQYRPGRSTRIALRYRIAELNSLDQLRLVFIEDLLRYRLMERLRRGDDKSVYSIAAGTTLRGPAAFFGISADLNPGQERVVRAILDDEISRLARTAVDSSFFADRDALSRRIRVENSSPAALRAWATDRFYRPDLQPHFPDVAAYYETVGPDSIAALAGRLFRDENRILYVWRPLPLPAAAAGAAALLIVLLAARLYRHFALRPADMARVRYVARARPPIAARLAGWLVSLVLLLVVGRLVAAGIHIAAQYWILSSESVAVPVVSAAALLFMATLAAFAALGRTHRKILVFEHEVRIKSPTYRAVILPLDRIRDASVVSDVSSVRLRHLVIRPLGQAVLLRLEDGSGYAVRVARPEALAGAVTAARAAARAPATTLSAHPETGAEAAPGTAPPVIVPDPIHAGD
jgi:predicted Zn-dependent peptidase